MSDPYRFHIFGPDDELRHVDDLLAQEDEALYQGGEPLILTNCPECHYNYRFCRCEPQRRPPRRNSGEGEA